MRKTIGRAVFALAGLLLMTALLGADGPDLPGGGTGGGGFGSSPPLVITEFAATRGPDNYWSFDGAVTGADPSDIFVIIAGVIGTHVVGVEEDGTFHLTLQLSPDLEGSVAAQAFTWWGQSSNIAEDIIAE